MITSATTGMEHPRAVPIVAVVDNPLLPSVLLTHFALSAEDVNKPMYH